ncbi:MAG: glutamyl-tRNA reductase [Anaerolineales bacterium]
MNMIICIGLSHATTPIALRERFCPPENTLKEFMTVRNGIEEYALLSTCNRLEVYAVLPGPDESCLLTLFENVSGLNCEFFTDCIYRYTNQDAVRHLARVATGLDSLIVGESQILGQVIDALETARQCGITGPTLNAVFRSAIHAGKRARSETEINRNPVSISSVAVRLAQDALGDLSRVRVLVIGAGEMAGLAVEALQQRGVAQITVVNRTLKTARALAERCAGQAFSLSHLDEALANTDLVIASSGAPYIVVTPTLLQRLATAQSAPRKHPLVFIDIAVPRNISPEVTYLPDVLYYDIDSLTTALDEGLAGRERSIPQVKAIIAEEVAAYQEWERQQQVAPIIASLYAKAEVIRQAEIERSLRRWPNAGESERKRLEALTEAVINRLLHQAILHLKANAGEEQATQYAAMLQELFALDFSI